MLRSGQPIGDSERRWAHDRPLPRLFVQEESAIGAHTAINRPPIALHRIARKEAPTLRTYELSGPKAMTLGEVAACVSGERA